MIERIVLALAELIVQTGIASVYTDTAVACRGERYRAEAMTAAHATLPCGTWVKVTNLRNGREIRVRIVDRGPFVAGRIIDLTPEGERRLGFDGLVAVQVEVVAGPTS